MSSASAKRVEVVLLTVAGGTIIRDTTMKQGFGFVFDGALES